MLAYHKEFQQIADLSPAIVFKRRVRFGRGRMRARQTLNVLVDVSVA